MRANYRLGIPSISVIRFKFWVHGGVNIIRLQRIRRVVIRIRGSYPPHVVVVILSFKLGSSVHVSVLCVPTLVLKRGQFLPLYLNGELG